MATAPLNEFKSVTADLSIDEEVFYTTPPDTTAIILLAQVANITNGELAESANVTFLTSLNNTELVKNYTIPPGDAASVLTGKLVLEPQQFLSGFASSNNSLKITISILETR
jgi:hypothetical protein